MSKHAHFNEDLIKGNLYLRKYIKPVNNEPTKFACFVCIIESKKVVKVKTKKELKIDEVSKDNDIKSNHVCLFDKLLKHLKSKKH